MSTQWEADILAKVQRDMVREESICELPMQVLDVRKHGVALACADLFPSPVTCGAANEIGFQIHYNRRHGLYRL